jgi:hypothetical protein
MQGVSGGIYFYNEYYRDQEDYKAIYRGGFSNSLNSLPQPKQKGDN